MSNRPESG